MFACVLGAELASLTRRGLTRSGYYLHFICKRGSAISCGNVEVAPNAPVDRPPEPRNGHGLLKILVYLFNDGEGEEHVVAAAFHRTCP
jgi:hypothetical protein